MLTKPASALIWTTRIVTGCLFVGFFLVVLLQVILRYAFSTSFFWTEEAARFLFVWASFLGGAETVRRNQHIVIDILAEIFPASIRKVTELTHILFSIVFLAIIFYLGYQFATFGGGQVSSVMRIPMWVGHLAIPVGAALMILAYLERLAAWRWRD